MDEDLRELERRFRETGDVAAHAGLIVARLRTGALDEERVALAARLGSEGATRVLGVAGDARSGHPWHADVRAALARRLLDDDGTRPFPRPKRVLVPGPFGLGGASRPPSLALGRAVEGAELWEVRAGTGGETEVALAIRGARARFADLASFWVEVALPHPLVTGAEAGETATALARRYLASAEPRPRDVTASFAAQAWVGPNVPLAELAELRDVLHAVELEGKFRRVHRAAGTGDAFFLYLWLEGGPSVALPS